MSNLENQACWVDGLTIGAVLRKTAQKYPAHDALVFPQLSVRLSYKALDAAVDACAKALLAMGVGKGDHVAAWATNVPEWPVIQLGAARMGAVFVTINPAYRANELAYVLNQGDVKALFLIDTFKSSQYHETLCAIAPELAISPAGALHCPDLPKLQLVVNLRGTTPKGMMKWDEFLTSGKNISDETLRRAEAACLPNEAINIQYTSGTTGFPKAATLTHRNILMNAFYVTDCQNISATDRMCIPVPYYHCFGLVMGTLGAVTRGAAMVIPAEYFDPAATLEAIEKERCTTLYGVPTMFIAQLQHETFAARNLTSLRSGIMAGSPCPIEVMRQVIDKMGMCEITIAYGLTEASPVITQTRVDDPVDVRVNTVGRPLPGAQVRLIDPVSGTEVANDEPGELCVKSHGVMMGYYNNEAATRDAIDADGWLRTGDLATRNAEGNYSITGRIKDMVCRGGENIYPREIEEFLFTHEAIEQAAVVGLPDTKYGEELCAWVRLKHGSTLKEDEIKAFCKASLAHYKVPRYVKFVEEFPQTVSGKIQKFKIREQMIHELGLTIQKTA